MKYTDLDLHDGLKNNINALGFENATPIQEMVLPHALKGKDISGLAQTGTGKTGAFLIPMINRILLSRDENTDVSPEYLFKHWDEKTFVLCLVPTRELAQQVAGQATALSKDQNLNVVTAVGGEDIRKQVEQIGTDSLDILIATPGRLIDLYKNHHIDLKQVAGVIFDEADRMFDMGFKDDMKYILKRLPDERQYLLFSATMNLDVLTVSYQFGAEPVECHLRSEKLKADNVVDEVFHLGQKEKPKYLLSLIKKHKPRQVIIFTNLKRLVEPITEFLQKNGYEALGISSLLNQRQRNRVLEHFKEEGKANILVATDLAARGLDVLGIDLVINYDLPDDAENYVHRIGRTGRAGQKGHAYSLSSDRDVEALARIEDYIDHKVTIGWMENDEVIEEFEAFHIKPRDQFYSERKNAVNKQRKDYKNSKKPGGNSSRKPRRSNDSNYSGESKQTAPKKEYSDNYKGKRKSSAKPKPQFANDTSAKPKHKSKSKPKSKSSSKKARNRKGLSGKERVAKRKGVSAVPAGAKAGIANKIGSVFKKLFS